PPQPQQCLVLFTGPNKRQALAALAGPCIKGQDRQIAVPLFISRNAFAIRNVVGSRFSLLLKGAKTDSREILRGVDEGRDKNSDAGNTENSHNTQPHMLRPSRGLARSLTDKRDTVVRLHEIHLLPDQPHKMWQPRDNPLLQLFHTPSGWNLR